MNRMERSPASKSPQRGAAGQAAASTAQPNLLEIDQVNDEEWFEQFELVEGSLTKCLVLVALLSKRELITARESDLMKELLMTIEETRVNAILNTFRKKQSLLSLRSEFRG